MDAKQLNSRYSDIDMTGEINPSVPHRARGAPAGNLRKGAYIIDYNVVINR
jgi:hypothetical protein